MFAAHPGRLELNAQEEIMMQIFSSVLSVLMMVLVLGCSSKGGVNEEGEGGDEASAQDGGRGAKAGKYSYGRGKNGIGGAGGPGSPAAQRVIYFGYDSDDVLPEYQSVVTGNAEYLSNHPDASAVLEGHADERGSSEYNIALGERRALSVARSLRLQGVGDRQLQILSYGEEKPATSGHEEATWQRNRRVEITYQGR
ncbi:MAG: peptidoglycan-associated lipoprotein Pal [Methylococcus sp.]|jgi:peptidoglycan-associated lipoprotein|nr:MAG: peptidoglycan-associated lipoprotein Pal [Methylococcus sp.]